MLLVTSILVVNASHAQHTVDAPSNPTADVSVAPEPEHSKPTFPEPSPAVLFPEAPPTHGEQASHHDARCNAETAECNKLCYPLLEGRNSVKECVMSRCQVRTQDCMLKIIENLEKRMK
jgi:hypothetical protein